MIFTLSFDKTLKIMTTFVTVLFAAIIIGSIVTMTYDKDLTPIFVPILLMVVYVVVYIYSPKSYSITDEAVIINRIAGDVIIKRSEIVSVEIPDKVVTSHAIRTLGVGGLFGYYGSFYQKSIGAMTWYVTKRSNAVLIRTARNERILVSPDEVEKFVAQFN